MAFVEKLRTEIQDGSFPKQKNNYYKEIGKLRSEWEKYQNGYPNFIPYLHHFFKIGVKKEDFDFKTETKCQNQKNAFFDTTENTIWKMSSIERK